MEIIRLARQTDSFYCKECGVHLWYYMPSAQVPVLTETIKAGIQSRKLIHVNAIKVEAAPVEVKAPVQEAPKVEEAAPAVETLSEEKKEEKADEPKTEKKTSRKGKKDQSETKAVNSAKIEK